MCQYCSIDLRNAAPREITLDHFIPYEAGGSNGSGNLLTACASCNSTKAGRDAEEYFGVLGHRRGYRAGELLDYIYGAMARAEYQMSRPLNRRLSKALIEGRDPTSLFDSSSAAPDLPNDSESSASGASSVAREIKLRKTWP